MVAELAGQSSIHTNICAFQKMRTDSVPPPRKANLGELAIQEVMAGLALESPSRTGVFLFEDHKIARAGFFLIIVAK